MAQQGPNIVPPTRIGWITRDSLEKRMCEVARLSQHLSVLLIGWVLALVLVLASCGGEAGSSVAGRYEHEDRTGAYMELKADGTMFGEERGFAFAGKYQVEGDRIIFTLASGSVLIVTRQGDDIIEPDSTIWFKR